MRIRACASALTIGLAPMLLHATPAAAVTLTDVLIFSADGSGNAIPGHGLDTLNGPHLNGSDLFDVSVSSDLTTPWTECEFARNSGSVAILVVPFLSGADDTGLEEIELPAAVHLTFHELELGDLAFGLAVRPRQCDGGADGCLISYDAIGE